MTYTYEGKTTLLPQVTAEFCPACDEIVFDEEQGDRYSELIGQFQNPSL